MIRFVGFWSIIISKIKFRPIHLTDLHFYLEIHLTCGLRNLKTGLTQDGGLTVDGSDQSKKMVGINCEICHLSITLRVSSKCSARLPD